MLGAERPEPHSPCGEPRSRTISGLRSLVGPLTGFGPPTFRMNRTNASGFESASAAQLPKRRSGPPSKAAATETGMPTSARGRPCRAGCAPKSAISAFRQAQDHARQAVGGFGGRRINFRQRRWPQFRYYTIRRTWAAAVFPSVYPLAVSTISSPSRRIAMLEGWRRFTFRLRSEPPQDLSQYLNTRRQNVTVAIDDVAEFPFESGGLLIG